jgi:hypothetical protein
VEESRLKELEVLASTPIYFCNKCGYIGLGGPVHGLENRCTYLAVDARRDLRDLIEELRTANLRIDVMQKALEIIAQAPHDELCKTLGIDDSQKGGQCSCSRIIARESLDMEKRNSPATRDCSQ